MSLVLLRPSRVIELPWDTCIHLRYRACSRKKFQISGVRKAAAIKGIASIGDHFEILALENSSPRGTFWLFAGEGTWRTRNGPSKFPCSATSEQTEHGMQSDGGTFCPSW